MGRYLINALAAVSLIFGLAVCVIWVRSYWAGGGFVWKPGPEPDYFRLYVGRGGLRVGTGQYSFDIAPYLEYYPERTPRYPTMTLASGLPGRLGFNAHRGLDSKGKPSSDLVLPLWSIIVPALVLPG